MVDSETIGKLFQYQVESLQIHVLEIGRVINSEINCVVLRDTDDETFTYGIGIAEEHNRCDTYVDIEAEAPAAFPAPVASDDVVVFDMNFRVLHTIMQPSFRNSNYECLLLPGQ